MQISHNPCSDIDQNNLDLLRDVAKMQMGMGLDYDSKFMEKAREEAEKRYKQSQDQKKILQHKINEMTSNPHQKNLDYEEIIEAEINDIKQEIERLAREQKGVARKDYDEVLSNLEKQGLIDLESVTPKLTSKGARLMGQGLLSRILLNLEKKGFGYHVIEQSGEGSWSGFTSRLYELGDPYHRIDIEKTILSAFERNASLDKLSLRDFHIFEPKHSTELHFGILVDQSASMRKEGKIEAANETALALSELMRLRYPDDKLSVFTFSEVVREIQPWMITALTVDMKFTDIRAALRAFRKQVAYLPGNKQANLVTDSAPNFLDGHFVGFNKASEAVINEARNYRRNGIILNIIMLDRDENLRNLAQTIAKENLGRLAFVDTQNLGEVILDDYIYSKRESIR
jgi:uncharacterized protein with von Willebrand factor type A (vWA) domain